MKSLKLIALAITATVFATPVFASGDAAQLTAQKRAFEKAYAEKVAAAKTSNEKALAGSTGPQGTVGPRTKSVPAFVNLGHPSQRVRR